MSQKIVLASSNPGKLEEIQAIVSTLGIEFVPQSEFNVPDVEETGQTFVENAIIKARHAAKITGLPAVADDSGLEVDVLKGKPGVHSARFAGDACNNDDNIEKLLKALEGVPESERTARMHSVIAYLRHENDPNPFISHGVWEGSIMFQRRGEGGFGYDPIFFVPEYNCGAAELEPGVKNRISHRRQSLERLVKYFREQSS